MMANQKKTAVLVGLYVSRWDPNKKDLKISQEVATSHGIKDARMGRFWKSLLPRNEQFKALCAVEFQARKFHYDNTLPWMQEGMRILPCDNYMDYMEAMRKFKAAFDTAVLEFIEAYPDAVEDAKLLLNGLFDAKDYPEASKLKSRFSFSTTVMPLPASSNLEGQGIPEEELERAKADVERELSAAFRAANRELWDRLFNAISDIQSRLDNPKGRVMEKTVDNLRSLLSVLKRLNVSGDPRLEQMRQMAEKKLAMVSPAEIRIDPAARKAARNEVKSIEDTMRSLMGGTPHA